MSDVLAAAAVLCGLLGLLCGVAVLLRARDPRLAVRVLVEFLLAGGLLHLTTGDPAWRVLLVVAVVVGLRGLLVVRPGRNPSGG